MNRRRAFTLVEILVALALGTAVCYVMFAGFRVASMSISLCNRLSLENQVMRAGFRAALDDVDFWRSVDDLDDPANQRLRAPGLPFAPMRFAAGELAFDQAQPSACWCGVGATSDGTQFGDYALFSRLGHPDAAHAAYAQTLVMLLHGLGYYAAADYLPAGEIYAWYDAAGKMPNESHVRGDGLYSIGGFNDHPRDLQGLTHGAAYGLGTDPDVFFPSLIDVHRHNFCEWYPNKYVYSDSNLHRHLAQPLALLAQKPLHWPALSVDVRRLVYYSRFLNQAVVRIASPITGAIMKFHFATAGTTLRGARRQRGLDQEGP